MRCSGGTVKEVGEKGGPGDVSRKTGKLSQLSLHVAWEECLLSLLRNPADASHVEEAGCMGSFDFDRLRPGELSLANAQWFTGFLDYIMVSRDIGTLWRIQ